MPSRTPTLPTQNSCERLLKRVQMCTNRSFERTPSLTTRVKRKQFLTSSFISSTNITLLSEYSMKESLPSTSIDEDSFFQETKHWKEPNLLNRTQNTTDWQIISLCDINQTRSLIKTETRTKTSGAKFLNKHVRDIDRLAENYGQEYLTLLKLRS
ncbi:unnamed protein product [Didymodactylos carnosus]|uniref:Uncharacterized protein n=1 Tax=Didymodactylos carnosus TaxID=1234261 RepID=A0A813ZX29_9BILA|nr:unnamed protein product [Didymodactylos carnosus]CAF0905917.1 unnamed protein product [Didymodactylos carnosus]CAF3496622.1 unnamed protein product [Didymodactylos carnosus]CAF3687681.1 unnamed protein product [Didymodactylos carnosus]